MITPGHNTVIVKLKDNQFYNTNLKSKTSEFSLEFDPSYNPGHHIKTEAEIVGVPDIVDANLTEFRDRLRNCETVFFDYKALEESDYVLEEGTNNRLYFLSIGFIFCGGTSLSIPKGENPYHVITIHPDWVICEPFYGFGWEEEDGQKVRKSPSGIIFEMNPDPDIRIARIRESDDSIRYPIGSLVFREPNTNYAHYINGDLVYMVRKENIDGILTGNRFSHENADHVNDYKNVVDKTEIGESIQNIEDL